MFIEMFWAIGIFSFVPLVIKFCSANPFAMGFFRLSVGTLLVSLYWRKKINWKVYKEKDAWKLLLIGATFFCHWITYTFSVKLGSPSMTVLGMATYGIQMIFYGAYFLGYHVRPKNIFCLLLILVGVFFVLPSWDLNDKGTIGFTLALISASFYATIPIQLQKAHIFNMETRTFAQFSVAFLGYVFLVPNANWRELVFIDWMGLLFLGVLGTFVAHSLWSRVVAHVPTTTSGIVYYIITPTAMFLSWLLLGETLSSKQLLGAGIILSGAIINMLKLPEPNKKGPV